MGDSNGFLTVNDIKGAYNVKDHPDVKAGKMSEEEALKEFLEGFEGEGGDHNGVVTNDEWIKYYEEISSSIDDDDYFGTMLVNTWSALKTKLPDGTIAPAITYTPASAVNLVEKILKQAIYNKQKAVSESKVLAAAFKQFDVDKSGECSFKEFVQAMERFGLCIDDGSPGCGGVPMDVLRALFDRYDTGGEGSLSYEEFAKGLFEEEAKQTAESGNVANPLLPSLAGGVASRPGTAAGSRPATATRVRSLANMDGGVKDAGFKKSNNIFG